MKITNLLEMTTPTSDPGNMGGSQAPKFGRDPHVLEDEKIEETTAGSVATGEPTNMGMQRRGKGSMFQGIKTSKKFVNSPVTEAEKDPEQEKIDSLHRSRQEKERGSERELGKDPKPTGQYYIMINGTTYKKDGEAVMFNSSIEAHRAVERIRAFRKSKGWSSARYDVIQQKGMEEALDPKALSALQQAKQSIAKNREADVAAWEQDFRKNFASKYGSQMPPSVAQRPLNIPSTKPTPKPLEKHSVLKNRMVSLNAVIDKQKYLDYLTFKAEQKGLLNPRLEADIDTSLYVKDAEKDDYQALNQKLDKSIDLMKNRLGINKLAYKKPKTMREEEVAEGLPQTLRKVVPGYAKREIDKKMDAGKFGKTDADKDANFHRYKKIQDKIKEQGVTEMDKSSPQPGRDGRVSHSTYGSRDKGGSKGPEKEAKPITAKKAVQHALDILKKQGVAEAEKNPHTSALGRALYRDLSKEKKASPAQVQRNKERWAKRQAEREQGVAEGYQDDSKEREENLRYARSRNPVADEIRKKLNPNQKPEKEQGVAEGSDVMEAELSEEQLLASELKKKLELFKKSKDRDLGSKPNDKTVQQKEVKEGQLASLPVMVFNKLKKQYPNIVRQYGNEIVVDAVKTISGMHNDMNQVDDSDVGIITQQVIQQLNRHLQMREEKQRLDPSCWKGYKKQGTKMKGNTRVNNCVPK